MTPEEFSTFNFSVLNILITSIGFGFILNNALSALKKILYCVMTLLITSSVVFILYRLILTHQINSEEYLVFYYIAFTIHLFIIFNIFTGNHIKRTILFTFLFENALLISILSYLITVCMNWDQHIFYVIKLVFWCFAIVLFKIKLLNVYEDFINSVLMNRREYTKVILFNLVLLVYQLFCFVEVLIESSDERMVLMSFVRFIFVLYIIVGVKVLVFSIIEHTKNVKKLQKEVFLFSKRKDLAAELENIEMKLKIERHDQKHIFSTVKCLIADNNTQMVLDLIESKNFSGEKIESTKYCENDIVNAVLTSYFSGHTGINASVLIDIPKEFSISSYDIATLMGNLIENAVNNCHNSNHPKTPFIELRGGVRRSKFVLVCKNSCDEYIQFKNGVPVNKNRKGYGIESMLALVEKYNGNIIYSAEDGVFTANLILTL